MAMNIEELLFWQEWPAPRQRAFFRLLLLGWVALLGLVWLMLAGSAKSASSELESLAARQLQVKPMIDEILRLKAQKGALAGLAPMPATQQVIRELGLEPKLSSIRPTQIGGGGDGVQVMLERFNLPETVKLLESLDTRGGLKIISFSLSHRLDAPKLADLQLVLGR